MTGKKRGRPAGAQEQNRLAVAKLYQTGQSDELIASELGISEGYVKKLRLQSGIKRYRRRPFGPEKTRNIVQVRRLFKAGNTDVEIADKLEIALHLVGLYRREMRLLRPRGRKKKSKAKHDT